MEKGRERMTWPGDADDEIQRRVEKEKREQEEAQKRRAPATAPTKKPRDKE